MTSKEYDKLKEGTPVRITNKLEEGRIIKHYIKYISPGLSTNKGIMVGTMYYSYKDIELVKEN